MAFQLLCSLDDLPEGAAREFFLGSRIIAAFHTSRGIHALDGMCAHQGGPIAQGALDGDCITCPWHGWQYDIRNGKNLLTGKQMLDCFVTEIRGSEIWIEVGEG